MTVCPKGKILSDVANLPPLFQLADLILKGELANFLRELRSQGDSWETIAKRLGVATDQRVDVSGATVQGWFERLVVVPA